MIYKIQYFNFLVYFLFILLCLISIFYLIKKKDKITYVILFSLILVSVLVIIGSVQPGFAGGRYAVVPGVILIFMIFRFYILENKVFLKNLFLLLLISSLTIGIIEFRYMSPLPQALKCINNDY